LREGEEGGSKETQTLNSALLSKRRLTKWQTVTKPRLRLADDPGGGIRINGKSCRKSGYREPPKTDYWKEKRKMNRLKRDVELSNNVKLPGTEHKLKSRLSKRGKRRKSR